MTEVSGRLMHKNLDFLFQAVAQVHPCGLGSKMGLDACPELNRVPKIACKPERSVSTDAACPPANFIDRMTSTLRSWASRYWLIFIGFRNSSKSISPGCTGGKSSCRSPQ